MIRFFLLSTFVSIGLGGYMLGSMLDKAEEGGVNISTAQLCSNEVQHGFRGVKKTMAANQLQIETLSFCMAAAQNAVGERVKIQIEGLNLKYTALEGAKPRAPLMFMLDGDTYASTGAK